MADMVLPQERKIKFTEKQLHLIGQFRNYQQWTGEFI